MAANLDDELENDPTELSGENNAGDSTEGESVPSMEDTGENLSLQEQEAQATENNGTVNPENVASPQVPKPLRGSSEAVVNEIRNYSLDLNDYLAWKENIRLTSVDLQIGGPYFGLWTKEANLIFRRLVILKKRSERAKSKQRA